VSLYAKARICRTHAEIAGACEALLNIPEKHYPIRLEVKRENRKRGEDKNRLLNAHFRDIARWRYGAMTVPERVFEQVVEDFKRSDVWPRYSNPEPDYYTGEVRYLPKSRGDLSDQEVRGIVDWLAWYILEHQIPVHAPEVE
jgi:hypothetical protein